MCHFKALSKAPPEAELRPAQLHVLHPVQALKIHRKNQPELKVDIQNFTHTDFAVT